MATQKRAINGSHYAFDSALGDRTGGAGHRVAHDHRQDRRRSLGGRQRTAALARPGDHRAGIGGRLADRDGDARRVDPDRDRGNAVGLQRDGRVDRRAGRQHERPDVVHREDRDRDGGIVGVDPVGDRHRDRDGDRRRTGLDVDHRDVGIGPRRQPRHRVAGDVGGADLGVADSRWRRRFAASRATPTTLPRPRKRPPRRSTRWPRRSKRSAR